MVAMLTALRQIGTGSQSSKRLEVVDEMRLVEVATGEREIGPGSWLPVFDQTQHFLKAKHSAKHLR